jgi:hypothetical protein
VGRSRSIILSSIGDRLVRVTVLAASSMLEWKAVSFIIHDFRE